MILCLPVNARAILMAHSLASVPEVAKKNLSRPLGITSSSFDREIGAHVAGVSGADERELLGLLADGVDDGLVLVPEVGAHQLRAEIEVALARQASQK
jgi:hypothetical protein